jgi:hypothetical protein
MASERPPELPAPEGTPPSQQAAAEVGAMVAEQVRRAIESAERSVEDLQRQARDRASADLEAVDRVAAVVLARIDAVEAKVGKLLQTLREEVSRTAEQARRAEVTNEVQRAPDSAEQPPGELPAAEPAQSVEPAAPTPPRASQPAVAPARARRRGLFGRRRGPRGCAVCGRAPRASEDALEGWRRTGKLGLCPDCQDDGWRLPAGARLPYRSTPHEPT